MPRLVYVYKRQEADHVDVYTDTDWAGCVKTRKSTSGGCVLLGGHTIKHWSSTQASVTLSSGEAEFAGVIRGAGQGLGYQALLRDLGVHVPLRVWTDSSAAIGICSRQGLGKLRHLDTHTLWIQQAVRCGRVILKKVPGTENPADLLTKHSISRDGLLNLVKLYNCKHLGGRADSAPQMRKGVSNKKTMGDIAAELGNMAVEDPVPSEGEHGDTFMPHLAMGNERLDAEYPSIVAPPDEDLEDPVNDEHDTVLQYGLGIASGIADDMARYGRTRRDNHHDDNNNNDNGNDDHNHSNNNNNGNNNHDNHYDHNNGNNHDNNG
jgi:hypothetical protein